MNESFFVFSTITIINDNELIDKEQNACYIVVLHMISIVSYKLLFHKLQNPGQDLNSVPC